MSEKHAQEALLAQLEINKAEAASGSIFKGGWRPAVGWTCAIAFLYHFILKDLIIFGCAIAGVVLPDLPEFDMGTLLTVLGGMLGIGGLRTYEKQKGLTK
jgi:ABC-type lipopolysaccharide export system ATPase subunit